MSQRLLMLSWSHPVLGDIVEPVCERHRQVVSRALNTLGIGSLASDGSAGEYRGPDDAEVCLRCQAHPAMSPRVLLRQWFGTIQDGGDGR